MNTDISKPNNFALVYACLFFLLVFLFYTYPMGLSDYWWHMNNGRWIWEHMSIPWTDQFSYAYARDDDVRRVVITRAYYLGQVSYYFLYSAFGIWGLLFYKAFLLTLPLWLLWRFMSFQGVNSYLSLVLISPLPFILYRFDELRPHIFAFIGAILMLYLIERLLRRLRHGGGLGYYWLWLPLTMLLWANLHRGFIIGWVLLLAYAASEVIKYWSGKDSLNKRVLRELLLLFSIAIGISFLNPNGVTAFTANFVELSGPFMAVIDEYFPLYEYAALYGNGLIFYGAVAIVLFGFSFMMRQWRTLQWVHGFLFLGFAWEGFSTFRFSYFQAVCCLALASPYMVPMSQTLSRRFPVVLAGLALLSVLLLGWGGYQRSAFLHGPLEEAYLPQEAARFLQTSKVPGKIFNAFEYGGYLGWQLYPEYEIFIDQRNLDFDVYQEYGAVWQGQYQRVFDRYGVNTVVFYIRQPVLDKVPALVNAMLQDVDWQVVYLDRKSVVLVRASQNPGLAILDKNKTYQYVNQK